MRRDLNYLSTFSAYFDFIYIPLDQLIYLSLNTFHDVFHMMGWKLKEVVLICYQDQQISITIIKHILNQIIYSIFKCKRLIAWLQFYHLI